MCRSKVYNVDKVKLNKQYRSYQFILHPDRHATKSEQELELITSNSSVVNGHYRTLLDDKSRAKLLYCIKYGEEVLASRLDVDFAQNFKTEVDKSDPTMLANIMDVGWNRYVIAIVSRFMKAHTHWRIPKMPQRCRKNSNGL